MTVPVIKCYFLYYDSCLSVGKCSMVVSQRVCDLLFWLYVTSGHCFTG